MNKEKLFYDIITGILLILGIIFLIISFFNQGESSFENVKSIMGLTMRFFAIIFLYALFYSIAIIVLIIRRQKGTASIIFMILGSIILVGILPLIYYIFYLRKKITRTETAQINQQV